MSAQRHEDVWQLRAACRGPHAAVFFPPPRFERKHERLAREADAKGICLSCDVREECLEYALANDERFGIWGGLSERERRKLKKRAV